MLLLHGFTGGPENWDSVVAHLPAELEIERPALLGHGREAEDSSESFTGEVDRLAGRLGVGPTVLAGYSMGGRVAVGLLARHRRLFSAALLIGAHPGLASAGERANRARRDEALARRLETGSFEAFIDFWQKLPLFESQRELPPALLEAQRAQRLRCRPAGLAGALRTLGPGRMPDYRPTLPALDLPIHLLAGERDDKFVAIARAMAEHLPHGSAETVPGAGHNLILEAPETVAGALVSLAEHAAQRSAKE